MFLWTKNVFEELIRVKTPKDKSLLASLAYLLGLRFEPPILPFQVRSSICYLHNIKPTSIGLQKPTVDSTGYRTFMLSFTELLDLEGIFFF